METRSSVFGTPLRDRILASLAMREQSHVGELARAFELSSAGVAKAVRQLERDGLIVAMERGRTRVLSLNPRWFAKRELRELLERMADAEPELYAPLRSLRARPRRSGKVLA